VSADHVAAAIERIKSDPEFAAAVLREPEAVLAQDYDLEPNEWKAIHYGLAQDVSRAIDFVRVEWLSLADIGVGFGKSMTSAIAERATPTVIPATPVEKMSPTVIPATPVEKMSPTVIPATPVEKMSPTVIPATPVEKMSPTVIPATPVEKMSPTVIPATPVEKMSPTVIPATPVEKMSPTAIPATPRKPAKKGDAGKKG